MLQPALLLLVLSSSVSLVAGKPQQIKPGCRYEGRRYQEGEVVSTSEPCLQCRCVEGALRCRLRVCPRLPQPVPPGCRTRPPAENACCPELVCRADEDENENILHRSNAAISHHPRVEEGCLYEGVRYGPGSAMMGSRRCEYCYCISGARRCIRPKCLLPLPGCAPLYAPYSCCPVAYNCTRQPEFSTTLAAISGNGCRTGQRVYQEGEMVRDSARKAACDNCFCAMGAIRCVPLACAPPLQGCKPIVREGQCCPSTYNCSGTIEVKATQNYASYAFISKDYAKFRKETNFYPAIHDAELSSVEGRGHRVVNEALETDGGSGADTPDIITEKFAMATESIPTLETETMNNEILGETTDYPKHTTRDQEQLTATTTELPTSTDTSELLTMTTTVSGREEATSLSAAYFREAGTTTLEDTSAETTTTPAVAGTSPSDEDATATTVVDTTITEQPTSISAAASTSQGQEAEIVPSEKVQLDTALSINLDSTAGTSTVTSTTMSTTSSSTHTSAPKTSKSTSTTKVTTPKTTRTITTAARTSPTITTAIKTSAPSASTPKASSPRRTTPKIPSSPTTPKISPTKKPFAPKVTTAKTSSRNSTAAKAPPRNITRSATTASAAKSSLGVEKGEGTRTTTASTPIKRVDGKVSSADEAEGKTSVISVKKPSGAVPTSIIVPDDMLVMNVTVKTNVAVGHIHGVTINPIGKPIPPDIEAIINITNRGKGQDYEYDYSEPTLPPSLPNVRIIPFVAADALVKDKDEDVPAAVTGYPTSAVAVPPPELGPTGTNFYDIVKQENRFSPPEKTEGGFVPREPPYFDPLFHSSNLNLEIGTGVTVAPGIIPAPNPHRKNDELPHNCLYEEREYGHGHVLPSSAPCITCICYYGEIVCTNHKCPPLKVGYKQANNPNDKCCSKLNCVDGVESPTVVLDRLDSTSSLGHEPTVSPDPFRDVIKTEPAPDLSSLIGEMVIPYLVEHSITTPGAIKLDKTYAIRNESQPGQQDGALDRDVVSRRGADAVTLTSEAPAHAVKEDEDSDSIFSLDSVLDLFFEEPSASSAENSTGAAATAASSLPSSTSTATTRVVGSSSATPTTTTTEEPSAPTTPEKALEKEPTAGGLLKLAGCNIYGQMYSVSQIIAELSNRCRECRCTELGVQCRSLDC